MKVVPSQKKSLKQNSQKSKYYEEISISAKSSAQIYRALSQARLRPRQRSTQQNGTFLQTSRESARGWKPQEKTGAQQRRGSWQAKGPLICSKTMKDTDTIIQLFLMWSPSGIEPRFGDANSLFYYLECFIFIFIFIFICVHRKHYNML